MSRPVALLLGAALLLLPSLGHASKGGWEDMPRFGMDLSESERADSTGVWTLAVRIWSQLGPDSLSAIVRIVVGTGAEVLDGAATRWVWPASSGFWRVKLRSTKSGVVRITGTLKIPGQVAGSYHYSEDLLVVELKGSDVIRREKRTIQQVLVQGGRRFRYGDRYLVAIDDDETEAPLEFLSRPEIITSPSIRCRNCGFKDTLQVPLVVTVGRRGLVTWIRPDQHGYQRNTRLWLALQKGLARYRFRPAMSPRGPVADYAILEVRVLSRE